MTQQSINPTNVYLFKLNNRNSTKKYHWRCSGVFIVNFEHISHLSIVDFEQVNVSWVTPFPIVSVGYEIEISHTTVLRWKLIQVI